MELMNMWAKMFALEYLQPSSQADRVTQARILMGFFQIHTVRKGVLKVWGLAVSHLTISVLKWNWRALTL